MSAEENEEGVGMNPDTNTDDEIGGLDIPNPEVQEAIPVAESAPAPAPADTTQPAPPPPPAGPRVFPQHYSLLFGAVVVLVGALSAWERAGIFGVEITGIDMISGTLLIAMALYCVIVGVINIITGRLRGMFASFLTGVIALYLAIKAYMRTIDQDPFQPYSTLKELPGESWRSAINLWVGQFGPGVWITLIGGALLTGVFLKAIVPGGKKQDAAGVAPARSTGARRPRR